MKALLSRALIGRERTWSTADLEHRRFIESMRLMRPLPVMTRHQAERAIALIDLELKRRRPEDAEGAYMAREKD